MTGQQLHTVLRHLRRLASAQGVGGLSDTQLLERFIAARDEAAFEVLVWRHGPMVLGLCRRILRQEQDAEDAFQATFLTLVRKASSISKRDSVASWLYKVAYRAALEARTRSSKRARHEQPLVEAPAVAPADDVLWRDLGPVLDDAVHRLPDKYRVPFVLCYIEGKTINEAAEELRCPRGTIATRLARARERLRSRLAGRGLAVAAGSLTLALAAAPLQAAVPMPLVTSTLRAALLTAVGPAAAAGVVSGEIIALTEGVLRTMFLNKLKSVAAIILTVVAVAGGAGGLSYHMQAAEPDGQKVVKGLAVFIDEANEVSAAKGERLAFKGWGAASDPAGDSKFTVEKNKLTISVPPGDHTLDIERNVMNAPRVLRDIEGDFIAQVKVSVAFPAGAASTTERRPFFGAGLLLMKDDRTYIRLESAHMNYNGDELSYANWEIRKDGSFDRAGDASELPLKDKDIYLRIERQGSNVYGSVSTDGVHWTTMEPIVVELPQKLKIGIAALQDTNIGYAAEFSDFKLFGDVTK